MSSKQPVIHSEPEPYDKLLDRIAFVFLLLQFLIPMVMFSSLDDSIPTRFDSSGEVSSTSSKYTVWILPFVGAFLYGMLWFLNKAPHTFNYPVKITPENAEFHYRKAVRMMRYTNLICMVMFTFIVWSTVAVGAGLASGLNRVIMTILLMLVFVPVGHHLYVAWKETRS